MSRAAETRLPCSRETRRIVKSQKRGGESYDTLLRKMAEQYDPETATEPSEGNR
jgi:hypothetical protein